MPAEIQHLLRLRNAADGRAGKTAARERSSRSGDAQRFLGCSDERQVAVAAEQVDIGVDVVLGGDRVEDEVEAAGMLLHLVGVARDDHLVGAEAERVFLFAGRSGEDHHVGAEGMSKLHAHVAQSAEADHANFFAFGHAPVAHRRVGGDSGAKQRRGPGKIEIRPELRSTKCSVDDNAVGVAAIGHAAEVLVREVIGEGHVRAELLKPGLALRAGAVGVDQAADCGQVARLELGHRRADLGDAADDLMARNNRIYRGHDAAPLVADLVDVGVADAAKQDFDLHVVLGGIATIMLVEASGDVALAAEYAFVLYMADSFPLKTRKTITRFARLSNPVLLEPVAILLKMRRAQGTCQVSVSAADGNRLGKDLFPAEEWCEMAGICVTDVQGDAHYALLRFAKQPDAATVIPPRSV